MNKTLSIGLAGFPFIIEEQAYAKLSEYLTALRNSLESDEQEEVMHDIEIRMVEIFRESLGKREIINSDDVEKVINQIGKPEVIEEQEDAFYAKNQKPHHKTSKVLFRDSENRKIGGVCSGLAHYIGMEISIVRAIWLGLALLGIISAGISTSIIIFIYVILWAVIPEAKSASDFLKMKGKPLNFDSLKEESNKVMKFANDTTQKAGELYNENKTYIKSAGNNIGKILRYCFGIFFGFIGIGAFISSITILGIGLTGFSPINLQFYEISLLIDNKPLEYSIISFAFLSSFIPALVFIFLSIKLLSPKTKFNHIGYVFGALVLGWLVLLAFLSANFIKHEMMYSGHNENTENIAINTQSDSLYLDIKKVSIPENFTPLNNGKYYYNDKTFYKKTFHPNVKVTREEGLFSPYLIIIKRARGYNVPIKLNADVEIIGNKILIPNYIHFPSTENSRRYSVEYELVIPSDTQLFYSKELYVIDDDKRKVTQQDNDFSEMEMSFNININGKKFKIIKNTPDSIIINGKSYHRSKEDFILDSLGISEAYDDAKDMQEKINKPEI